MQTNRPQPNVKLNLAGGAQLCVTPVNHQVVQVTVSLPEIERRESLFVRPGWDADGQWQLEETPHCLRLRSDAFSLAIHPTTGAIEGSNPDGEVFYREPETSRSLESCAITKTRFHPGEVEVVKTVDGERSFAKEGERYVDRSGIHAIQRFCFGKDEAIYGLGQHEEGILNYRGHWQHLFQANMKSPVPVFLSSKGYGVLFDTTSACRFDDTGEIAEFSLEDESALVYYIIYGPDFDAIIAEIRKLTGTASLLPKWAFGYIQSKERYKTADELESVVREYRRRRIPIDGIVQDWLYYPEHLYGQRSFDPERFPEPKAWIDRLHELKTRLMISVWPSFRKESPDKTQMRNAGYLLADDFTYDAFDPKAQSLFWEQLERELFAAGVDAWWCDSTEPFNPEWKGPEKLPPEERWDLMVNFYRKYLDPSMVNAFPLLQGKAVYEGQRQSELNQHPQKRVLNLTRSVFPGQQQYGCVCWSGDISARWDVLRSQIADGLNFCASGLPYWTNDIGGFLVGGHACYLKWTGQKEAEPVWFWAGDYDQGVDDPAYRELYTRWLQWAAFLPMMRSHGTDTPREVWQFGEPGELVYDTIVDFVQLRYRLLPYLYSLAGRQAFAHYTMFRLLAFDFREDAEVLNIADQFMLGPALMVCPITEPMQGGRSRRTIYLPRTCDWYDFWTGEKHSGGRHVEWSGGLERIPVFVREGSILPLGAAIQHTGESLNGRVTLLVYPGRDAAFQLYDDAGDSYDYEIGLFSRREVRWIEGDRLLRIGTPEGGFPEMPDQADFSVRLIDSAKPPGWREACKSAEQLPPVSTKDSVRVHFPAETEANIQIELSHEEK